MSKRNVFILLFIVIVITVFCFLQISTKHLLWIYKYPKIETPKYLAQNADTILLTTSAQIKHDNQSYLRIIDKMNAKLKAVIKLDSILTRPILTKNYIIVATRDNKNSNKGSIYVINNNTFNFIWKDQYKSNNWPFAIFNNHIIYVDSSGTLRNSNFNNNNIAIWKVVSPLSFSNSTKPTIRNGKFYICNSNQILAIDIKTSKVIYNFKTANKINSCSFNHNFAAVLMSTDDIYGIDLVKSKLLWKYKHVSLFSRTFLEIIKSRYIAVLSIKDLSHIKTSSRAKVINDTNRELQIINLKNGVTKWQKSFKYPINLPILKKIVKDNIIVFQTKKGSLTAFNLDNGNRIWKFYGKHKVIPKLNYTLKNNKVYLILNYQSKRFLYIINLLNGKVIDRIKITHCQKQPSKLLADNNTVYLSCKPSYLIALDLSYLSKVK